jgi:hypothetical protein
MVFAGTDGSGLFISKDNGGTWTLDTTGFNGAMTISYMEIDSTNLIASTSTGIFVSTDSGGSWTQELNTPYASALGVEGSNVFAIATTDKEFYASSDRGMSWTLVGAWPGFTYSLATLDGYIFAAEGGGQDVVRSSDAGAHWEQAGTGLPHLGPSFNCHYLLPYGQNLFVATDDGIFLTTDTGTTWINITDTVTEPENGGPLFVNTLLAWNGNLWAGVVDSLWVAPLSKIVGLSSVHHALASDEGITAYPNPFTQSSTISVTIGESGTAEIDVVNLLGEQIARVFDGELTTGNHSFTWNASAMPPGMYECVVWINGQMQQLPMLLAR